MSKYILERVFFIRLTQFFKRREEVKNLFDSLGVSELFGSLGRRVRIGSSEFVFFQLSYLFIFFEILNSQLGRKSKKFHSLEVWDQEIIWLTTVSLIKSPSLKLRVNVSITCRPNEATLQGVLIYCTLAGTQHNVVWVGTEVLEERNREF